VKPRSFILIAGETSGDLLAAELVQALREELAQEEAAPTPDYQPLRSSLEPHFFGAGGPRMAAAGVELAFDMTEHAVVGVSDVLKNYIKFRRLFYQLYRLAIKRQPDAIVCVDFAGFNRRFAHTVRTYVRPRRDWFHDWNPKLIQYVSPQVWASREGRAYQLARDYDLLLSIFRFEQEWYAKRVPAFSVEFVGNPIAERYDHVKPAAAPVSSGPLASPMVLLLPGSRPSELKRHLPILVEALKLMQAAHVSLRARVVLPSESLGERARAVGLPASVELQIGNLHKALGQADVALASTGTVTMECAYFGVPTVALYKTSWTNYQIAKQIVTVKYIAMPNLLANEEVFPEFIQGAARAENIARAGLELLRDEARRKRIKEKLAAIVSSLGGPGATRRAAQAIMRCLNSH
jgi:lipid-A-disaccharide synthase